MVMMRSLNTLRTRSLLSQSLRPLSAIRASLVSTALLCGVTLTSASNALAGGFEVLEQSATGVGQAFSGAATGYRDGSEVFFNPAAMTEINGDVVSLHGHLIMPLADFDNDGSGYGAALGGIPLLGNSGGNGGEPAFVPNLYVVKHVNEDLTLGFGLNSPFGLETSYNGDWVGRYFAVDSSLLTVNINPSIGYRVNDWLSVGAGLQVMYAKAELNNAVDFGTIGLSALGPQTAAQLGLLPQQADGFAEVEGDDWGVGYSLAFIVTPHDKVKVGFNYRSKIDFELEGSADFTVPQNAAVLTQSGAFLDTDATADLTLPEVLTFGTAVEVSPTVTWYADASWIRWSRFEELRIKYESVQPDTVQEENWNNTWRFSTGMKYEPSKTWAFRAGIAFDETPVSSVALRTPRIPDNDRYWIAAGATYNVTETFGVNLSYAHIFVPDARTDLVNNTGSRMVGDWESGVDIVSASIVQRF